MAFGSDAAHWCYTQAKLVPSKCETAIFLDLRPSCQTEADVIKHQKVTFLAALEKRKGLTDLLDAWRLADLDQDGWALHVAGSGPLTATVIGAATADSSIHYLGELDRAQIHALLAESAIVVLPSQPERGWKEQIGLSIVEGLAHGCQIVASSDTGLAKWLAEHGHTVLPPGFTTDDLARALRMACSRLMSSAVIRSSLPSNDGRMSAEKWMYQ
jgi:glycosyltransferase involved in cell wall biosynthesis